MKQHSSVCLTRSCDVIYIKKENICTTPSKEKVTVTGDSVLNGISEKNLPRTHKVTNFPGGTSEKIVDKFDDLIKVRLAASSSVFTSMIALPK